MQIVDTHAHVIAKNNPKYPQDNTVEYPWVADYAVDFEELTARFDAAGVQKAALVQAISGHGYDNSYTLDSAARDPSRYVGVGITNPVAPGAVETLKDLVQNHNMRGLRFFTNINAVPANWLDAPTTDPMWQSCVDLDIPVALQMRPSQIGNVRNVAERFPRLKLALDHAGSLTLDEGHDAAKIKALYDIAKLRNVYLKFSPNLVETCEEHGMASRELMGNLVDAFGADRLMWGSNYPARHEPRWTYGAIVEAGLDSVAHLSQSQQAWLMADTAISLYPDLAG